jgi:hypothetical protein
MMGHPVARSVSWEMEGNLGEIVLLRARRVDVFVPPKKGQEFLKRAKDESLSMIDRWEFSKKVTDYIAKSETLNERSEN